MQGFHSLWTLPSLKNDGKKLTINGDTIRKLTWIASIISWQKNIGPMDFYTDDLGYDYTKSLGILKLYNGKVSKELQNINIPVDPSNFAKTFWAYGKIIALNACKTIPCCSVDFDAIVWKPLHRISDVVFMNVENKYAWCYLYNKKKYCKYLPKEFDSNELWDKTHVYNTGVMAFFDEEIKDYYVNTVMNFVNNYSKQSDYFENIELPKYKSLYSYGSDHMVFAEQRMLSLCAELKNKTCEPITYAINLYAYKNEYASHLWWSKDAYLKCWDLKNMYESYLLKFIRETDDRAHELCDEIEKEIQEFDIKNKDKLLYGERISEMYELKNVKGNVRVYDTFLPTYMQAYSGMRIPPYVNIEIIDGQVEVHGGKEIRRIKSPGWTPS